FEVNLMTKRFYDPESDEWVTLKVSASGIRHINKRGLVACLKDARANGYLK
ncbi:MAG: bL28 family ribosomal protein, partial [Salibacteraceae bacterium]